MLKMRIAGVAVGLMLAGGSWGQVVPVAPVPQGGIQPDAQQTRRILEDLLRRYPPNLRNVFQYDPSLLTNQAYLAPYPALASFLSGHPEVARDPSFFVGVPEPQLQPDHATEIAHTWENVISETEAATAGILAMCLIAYLIRTFMDSRRWNRWTKVQTEAHTKLLDRMTNNEDLLAYVNSPAGSKFLQSSPMLIDSGPRGVTAPLGRILWTIQGGVVLAAAGIGLGVISRQVSREVQEPIHALGILAMALGIGFVVSAIVSFAISRKLGLLEPSKSLTEPNTFGQQG